MQFAKPQTGSGTRSFYTPITTLTGTTVRSTGYEGGAISKKVLESDPGIVRGNKLVFTRDHVVRLAMRIAPTQTGRSLTGAGEPFELDIPIEPTLFSTLDEALPPWGGLEADTVFREGLSVTLDKPLTNVGLEDVTLTVRPDRGLLLSRGVENTEIVVELWYEDVLIRRGQEIPIVVDGSHDPELGFRAPFHLDVDDIPVHADVNDLRKWRVRLMAERFETLRLYSPSRCWSGELWYSLDEMMKRDFPNYSPTQSEKKPARPKITPPTPPAP